MAWKLLSDMAESILAEPFDRTPLTRASFWHPVQLRPGACNRRMPETERLRELHRALPLASQCAMNETERNVRGKLVSKVRNQIFELIEGRKSTRGDWQCWTEEIDWRGMCSRSDPG